MKKYIALDTETTGFNPGQICQLSYVVFDEQYNIIKPFNRFYTVEKVEEGAINVHGLTVDKLIELSEGNQFIDSIGEVIQDLVSVDKIYIHNVPFDVRFMKAEFERLLVSFGFDSKTFCTMNHFTDICKLPAHNGRSGYKWPKLSEALAYNGVLDEFVKSETNRLFGVYDIGSHDARFDVVGVYILAQKLGGIL